MTTVVRLKRKRTDEPQEALVLSCKRAKQNGCHSLQTKLRLAGTVTNKAEVIDLTKLKSEPRVNGAEATRQVSRKRQLTYGGTESVPAKLQTNTLSTSAVLQIYDLETTDQSTEQADHQVQTFDRARETSSDDVITCNGDVMLSQMSTHELTSHEEMTSNKECDYVYDLFYVQDGEQFEYQWLEDAVMLECYNEDYDLFSEYRSTEFTASDRCMAGLYDDDDDSNDEDNWRNDYPDEDFDQSSDDNEDGYYEGSKGGVVNLDFNSALKITASDEDSSLSDEYE